MEEAEKIEEKTKEGESEEPKKKEGKKVVRRRKVKEKVNPLISAVRIAVESGKVEFGARTGIMATLLGRAKVFVIASNTPEDVRTKITDLANKSRIPVIVFPGSTLELGSVCGKPFPVSVLSVYDEGNSNILQFAKSAD
ncbi:MAG: 50S ribosomal protein L30e [Candidatus Bilamarchaeaceae archaeon]